MGPGKSSLNPNDIISSSEIGQYKFCSLAWYLQKCGYKPESKYLEIGKNKHNELGLSIDKSEKVLKKSRIISLMGYIFLICAIAIFIFEVVL